MKDKKSYFICKNITPTDFTLGKVLARLSWVIKNVIKELAELPQMSARGHYGKTYLTSRPKTKWLFPNGAVTFSGTTLGRLALRTMVRKSAEFTLLLCCCSSTECHSAECRTTHLTNKLKRPSFLFHAIKSPSLGNPNGTLQHQWYFWNTAAFSFRPGQKGATTFS